MAAKATHWLEDKESCVQIVDLEDTWQDWMLLAHNLNIYIYRFTNRFISSIFIDFISRNNNNIIIIISFKVLAKISAEMQRAEDTLVSSQLDEI